MQTGGGLISILLLIAVTGSTDGYAQSEPSAKAESYFDLCNNEEFGNTTIPIFKKGRQWVLKTACAPDTLYSWQPESQIRWDRLPENFLTGGRYLYTWRTPLATFGYGNIQTRIKLRPDVQFTRVDERSRDCSNFSKKKHENTVFVSFVTSRSKKIRMGLSDYLICSPKVAESWSVHTHGAYLEAMNEAAFIAAHYDNARFTYDAYNIPAGRVRPPMPGGMKSNTYFIIVDPNDNAKNSWGAPALQRNLYNLDLRNRPEMGKIYYSNPGVEHDPADHFKTQVDTYVKLRDEQLIEAVGALPSAVTGF